MKIFLIGLWLTAVALGATYAAALLSPSATHDAAKADTPALQHEKTRPINVPIIVDGGMQGFVGVQLGYTIDGVTLRSLPVSPEFYLLDAAFGAIYADKTIDFRHLERIDVPKLTKRLIDETNAHLGAPMVKDVFVEALSYIPKDSQKD